jgi:hypothetical protein
MAGNTARQARRRMVRDCPVTIHFQRVCKFCAQAKFNALQRRDVPLRAKLYATVTPFQLGVGENQRAAQKKTAVAFAQPRP